METQKKDDENQQAATIPSDAGGIMGMIYEQYHKARENAEAYPYVWSSYLLVYGGFGLWVAYRYRKLRNTEDRVRALQLKLHKLREKNASSSAKVSHNVPSSKSASSAAVSDNVPSSKSASSASVSNSITSSSDNPTN